MLELEYSFHQEGNWIVAYCEELQISSYGNTEEEATRYLAEAIYILLEELRDRGKLEDTELWYRFALTFRRYYQEKIIQEMGGFDKMLQNYIKANKDEI